MAFMSQSQPTPALFFRTINAYQETEALRAAIELDLFTAMDEGAHDLADIATRVHASERGVRILCDYLGAIGFLNKNDGQYSPTPESAMFLSRRSPAYLGGTIGFLRHPMMTDGFRTTADAVRKGGTILEDAGTMSPDLPVWVDFARSMAPMMFMPSQEIAQLAGAEQGQQWKVLDIAAGHGLFGIAIARQNPNARIVAVDWQAVLAVARENAAAAGVGGRYDTLAGSAFDVDLGNAYDVVLLTNFLHHFSPETNERLLRKVHAALKPGGRALTLDFVPHEDRISPPGVATFSLTMLVSTQDGEAYTFTDYERMFDNAGFRSSRLLPLTTSIQSLIVSEK
jgi:ubiquinone/menaquinone biosynthesis C-methylase UbiE